MRLKASKRGVKTKAKQLDLLFERLLARGWMEIDVKCQLRSEFGRSFGQDPQSRISACAEAREIRGAREAEIVRDAVVNLNNEESLGRDTYARSQEWLDEAGYESHNRQASPTRRQSQRPCCHGLGSEQARVAPPWSCSS